uniref:Uncharacterized protein n=1 Tax=Cacopsylla melanoneura TaxID=428564 RepID=A0A8D8M7F9_9HEMI
MLPFNRRHTPMCATGMFCDVIFGKLIGSAESDVLFSWSITCSIRILGVSELRSKSEFPNCGQNVRSAVAPEISASELRSVRFSKPSELRSFLNPISHLIDLIAMTKALRNIV